MHSLLKRWLHKCHRLSHLSLRSSTGKNDGERNDRERNDGERLEPKEIPTKYACEELATEFAKYWTDIREGNGEGLQEIQRGALERWHAVRFELGISTEQHPLLLDFFVDVFDDYFFLGSLRQYLTVKIVDGSFANPSWAGLTKGAKRSILSGSPEVQIKLKRLPDQLWTRELIQDFLDTLLHEMSHAFLMIYTSPVGDSGRCEYRRVVETEGLTGHGPCWVKVAGAVAAEADRSLGRVWDKWELKIGKSCRLEKKTVSKRGKR